MIDKQQHDQPGVATVTFRLPREAAGSAAVVGEFNDWSTDAHPMEQVDGQFVLSIELPTGRAYRFRYLLDGERWENDWAADSYQGNEYGGDDSVVDLTRTVEPTTSTPQPALRRRTRSRSKTEGSRELA